MMDAPGPLEVRAVPGKGRGVFLRCAVAAGTVLEVAAAVELSAAEIERLRDTVLDSYYFAHPEDPERGCVVFGHASLLNHSTSPNVRLEWRRDPEAGWLVTMVAETELAAGIELVRRYSCPPWFEVVERTGTARDGGDTGTLSPAPPRA